MGVEQGRQLPKRDWFSLWAVAFVVIHAFLLRDCFLARALEARVIVSDGGHRDELLTVIVVMACVQIVFLIAAWLRQIWGAYGIVLCGAALIGASALVGFSYPQWAPSALATLLFIPAGIWHWRSKKATGEPSSPPA